MFWKQSIVICLQIGLIKFVLIKWEHHRAPATFTNNNNTIVAEYINTHRTYQKHKKHKKMKK